MTISFHVAAKAMTARQSIGALCGALLLAAGCGSNDQDPHHRVDGYEGRLEADLRREVGPPDHEQPVATDDKDGDCGGSFGPDAVRELTYDVPSRGAEKRVRKKLGLAPQMSYVACVDRTGRIVNVVMSRIN